MAADGRRRVRRDSRENEQLPRCDRGKGDLGSALGEGALAGRPPSSRLRGEVRGNADVGARTFKIATVDVTVGREGVQDPGVLIN